ncbi:MAG TPA: hypothetical protein DCR74_18395, partial [Achromobacter sp.]|nr:hypothetical protein [Achromobacter sp.]
MSRRFPLTRIAVLLSLSLPFAAPSAIAQSTDYIMHSGMIPGDVVNVGDYASITLVGGTTVTGDVINDGLMWPTFTFSPYGGIKVQSSTIQGSIINKPGRQLTSNRTGISLTGGAFVGGDIINEHGLTGDTNMGGFGIEVASNSTVIGKIVNNGTIDAGIVVSGGQVNGGIVNNGTIKSASNGVAVDVVTANTLTTITNTGLIQGDVMLGASTLNLNGGDITGAVIGATGIVNINGDFGATSKISVGQINVAAGKTLTLNDANVKGVMNVKGTLAGSGEVGPTTLESGATLSPSAATVSNPSMMGVVLPNVGTIPVASPIGMITVNGDLTFKPGSTYLVDATADGKKDRVKVIGTANLAGSVVHVGSGGTYAESTAYTILSATSLNGHFDSASSDMAYLQPSLSHQDNQVVLTLDKKQVPAEPDSKPSPGKPVDNDNGNGNSNTGNGGGNTDSGTRPIEFADLAVTGNQRSAANAVQSLPKNSSLYTRVLNLPNGAPAGVFADLSGESFGSSVSAMQNVSNNVASLPTAQLRANMN